MSLPSQTFQAAGAAFSMFASVLARKMLVQAFAQRTKYPFAHPNQQPRVFDQIEKPGARNVGAFHLLHLELLSPGDDRPPHNLVHRDDHGNHGTYSPQDRLRITGIGSGLQVGTESGQTKILGAEHEHLADHQHEPAARHRHHGVPHQADGRVRQLQLDEALIPTQPVDLRGLSHLARNTLQRRVEAERHVPHLPGEDEQDRAHLDADLASRKQRHHRQHDARQKAEHRNRLQDVEQRNHDALGSRVVRGNIAVHQRERQRQDVSNPDA